MSRHQNKHIEAAIQYAVARGWRVVKAGPRAHGWGKLFCPAGVRNSCIVNIASTPSNPQNHAAHIKRQVDSCPH